MLGLITMPILGWNLGTWLGGAISAVLPQALQNAMGIALYAMFIALILPAARKSRSVCCVIILAVVMVCILKICSGFCRYFLRFPGDSGYDRGIGVRCMEIPA